ncbi:assimilatory sulfite reductase (NADPH) flavoprotein subunit [Pseudomarimonas salicorniae]|uniref:Assimilatory sulfite reductase (NADPH) flavoprotein subunit n=1 Tax=Pseudomarimonas salicorniae TaxID=2933270 RepID=A0ABT0GGE4_9GAMM|nr:assimilatory sulfite reductase (NADPH) flavoprotein subunit [Lysobacter sp. CAU 1642]MCK7593605.1 assimilatory sulfite reductase (NADPH) flavoprotein subunit [Lysobacter sp. CAU 1642]
MSALPRLPELLPAENAEALSRAVAGLEAPALWWLSGYAAGLAHARGGAHAALPAPGAAELPLAAEPQAESVPSQRLSIVYGSQTGNAKRAAEALAAEAEASGLAVRLFRADAYPLRELKDERLMSFVFSTQGEGDPSDDALGFFEFLDGRRAPQLPQLKYSVLALGDSSYAKFCEIGRRLDARLAALGASAVLPRAEADVDIDAVATPWRGELLGALRALQPSGLGPARATVTPLRRAATPKASREAPFVAELLANQRISGRDSEKDVRHVELDLAESGLHYEPGDALGVWAENPPALVEAVLAASRLDGEQVVSLKDRSLPLRDWLASQREITRSARGVLAALAERSGDAGLADSLAVPERTAALLGELPLVEALRRWPVEWDAQGLVEALKPMSPRLYSIASSRAEVGEEAHLTVDVLRYAVGEGIHVGAASSHIARRSPGGSLRVYVEPNERFRLPADGARDLIMIGAGTGIAPYRGFLQQRIAEGARGRHWLVFGAQRFASDFLYQAEWLKARKDGRLARIDLAFSRDQAQKVYVQQRLREEGRVLLDWVRGGAHLYVCGAIQMGKDVHAALVEVFSTHGGLSREDAEAELRALQQAGRYARDVY